MKKIKSILEEGVESVHIVTDFDMTLTRDKVDGKNASSCFTAIQKSDFVSDAYIQANKVRIAPFH